jgi:hypothetical protein
MIKIKFLSRKFLYKYLTLQPLFQSAQRFYLIRKDPEPDSHPDPVADPGCPKKYGSYESGSGTLKKTLLNFFVLHFRITPTKR